MQKRTNISAILTEMFSLVSLQRNINDEFCLFSNQRKERD